MCEGKGISRHEAECFAVQSLKDCMDSVVRWTSLRTLTLDQAAAPRPEVEGWRDPLHNYPLYHDRGHPNSRYRKIQATKIAVQFYANRIRDVANAPVPQPRPSSGDLPVGS